VLLGRAYVLFFAPLEDVDPSSLNRNSPLWLKIVSLSIVVLVMVFGYVINRIGWNRLRSNSRNIQPNP
jgi:hypothetical protein